MPKKEEPQYKYINPLKKEIKPNSTKKVYHYTSPLGLKSILANATLRFSDCQFLNDKSEYTHIKKPLQNAFQQLEDELNINFKEEVFKYIDKKYEYDDVTITGTGWGMEIETTKMRYYIFCTSMTDDSLGMWNYYIKDGNYQGYNIGFTVNRILNCFDSIIDSKVFINYGEVIYDENEQIKILKKMLIDADRELERQIENIEEKEAGYEVYQEELQIAIQNTIGEIVYYIEKYRLFFKDSAFKNESEFRFVMKLPTDFNPEKNETLQVNYNLKHGIFVPYCDLKIDKSKTINSIMLSPMLEDELAKSGLERFLKHHGYNNKIQINQSKIPIRY